jgi:hypothetical protein
VNYDTSNPFTAALPPGLTQDQINLRKAAIAGHLDHLGCQSWFTSFGANNQPGQFVPLRVVNPTTGQIGPAGPPRNNCQLLPSQVYDPTTNPSGYRCGPADHAVAIWGRASGASYARVTRDNVGVQYGLKALASGAITPEEFVTLNERIGSTDIDSNLSASRMAADPDALTTAYASGIVSDGRNLAKVAIIDLRGNDNSGIHHTWRSYSLRERLDKANSNHDNHVLWRFPIGLIPSAASGLTLQSFLTMDKWLSNIEADKSTQPIEQKIARNKPPEAVDFCYLSGDTGFTTKVTDQSRCDADLALKSFASPRQTAGGPLSENVLKCQLKPFNIGDYNATFTSGQLARLQLVFASGVCDWSKPGVNQKPANSPLTFEAGPGGKPLGSVPTSTPL